MHMHTLSPTRSTVLVRLAAMVLSNTHARPVCFPIITYRYESLFFPFHNVFVSVACVTACVHACRCIFALSLGGPDVWLEFPAALVN
jgi:hypothetical protein